jgi:hypothetical protein
MCHEWEVSLLEHCNQNLSNTKCTVDYNTIQKFITEKNPHFFIFHTKADKLVKGVIRNLPGNNSTEDITVASRR